MDQCFGELGRQMQRETKVRVNSILILIGFTTFFLFFLPPNTARQEIENKLTASNSEVELDLETKIRIEKLENAIKETQKVVHAPSFKLLSKELKKIEDCRLARVSSKSLSNKGSSDIINNVFLKIDRFFNFL